MALTTTNKETLKNIGIYKENNISRNKITIVTDQIFGGIGGAETCLRL